MDKQDSVRVLIAEDDYLVSLVIKRLLEESGHQVVGLAADGQEAFDMACSLHPDAVLMDIQMPGIDGIEATRMILASCPTPVIFLTAYDSPELAETAMVVGGSGYLVKMPGPQELKQAIRAAIDSFGK